LYIVGAVTNILEIIEKVSSSKNSFITLYHVISSPEILTQALNIITEIKNEKFIEMGRI